MLQISELRRVPHFSEVIADRGWHEWWSDTDTSLLDYRKGIEQIASISGLPAALVAHDKDHYAGSVLLIHSDLDERPEYSPWIAALWVEPAFRRQGVAEALIGSARAKAHEVGFETCFLCANSANSPYYAMRGFQLFEEDVAGMNIFTISS